MGQREHLCPTLAYLDVGLDDLRREVPETSEDPKRVVYEDHKVELQILLSRERLVSPKPSSEVAKTRTSVLLTKTVTVSTAARRVNMEGIPRYTSIGGGLSQRQFKQDAKVAYIKILRDPREHLMVGFGQWEFITLLGPRL